MEQKRRLARNVLVIVFVLALGFMVTYGFWGPKPQPFGTPVVAYKNLINETITVNQTYAVEFSVPNGAFNIQVTGNFNVSNNNSIRVAISNDTNVNGAIYDSGQSDAANFSVNLPSSGTYYLVYDNRGQTAQTRISTQAALTYLHK